MSSSSSSLSLSSTSSSSSTDSDSDSVEHADAQTGEIDQSQCDFCQKKLLETENEIKLDCNHSLCPNCFNFFKSQRKEFCPICFAKVSNFTKEEKK